MLLFDTAWTCGTSQHSRSRDVQFSFSFLCGQKWVLDGLCGSVRSAAPLFLFSSPETGSTPLRACGHCLSLSPKGMKAHYSFLPLFILPSPFVLWKAWGSKSCALLHPWYNSVVLCSRVRCLLSAKVGMLIKSGRVFSSHWQPFWPSLSLCLWALPVLHLCPCFLKSPCNLSLFGGNAECSPTEAGIFALLDCVLSTG